MSCIPGMPCFAEETTIYYPVGCGPAHIYPTSNTVVYVGPNLPDTGINTMDSLTTALEKIDSHINAETILSMLTAAIATNPTLKAEFCALVAACSA